jgi:hypothetical protein
MQVVLSFHQHQLIVCLSTNLEIYIWRYQESNRIGDLFQRTNGYVYINFQLAVYVNDIFIYLSAFSCFFLVQLNLFIFFNLINVYYLLKHFNIILFIICFKNLDLFKFITSNTNAF